MHLSCGVPCKSQVFYFIFTRHSRCCGFPTSLRAAISLSPRPQTFPHHHSEICELRETDVLSAWRSTRAQERLAAGGGREGRREISFKQIFLPAPLTLQSRGVSYQPRQHTARQLQPAACPPVHPPLRLPPSRGGSGSSGGVPATPLQPSGAAGHRSRLPPAPSLRSPYPGQPGGDAAGGYRRAPSRGGLAGGPSPSPIYPLFAHRPLQEQQQQHFAKSHPTPERAG